MHRSVVAPTEARKRIVVIVDDDAGAGESLAALLEELDLHPVIHTSAEALLAVGIPREACCLLVDVRLGNGQDGISLIETLRQEGDRTPTIVVTGHGDVPLAVRAMRLGVADFVEKPFTAERLVAALEQAQSSGGDAARIAGLVASLTPREREVLAGLVEGKPNKVVASDLGISVRTVEAYRANIMEKLGVRSFAEAIRLALAAGIGA